MVCDYHALVHDSSRYARLLAMRPYNYCVYQTGDGTMWVEAWRSSAKVSSAMYAVVRKFTREDPAWTQEPDDKWIDAAVVKTLAGSSTDESRAMAEEFAQLDLEAPTPADSNR